MTVTRSDMIYPLQRTDVETVENHLAFQPVPVLLDVVVLHHDDHHVDVLQELIEVGELVFRTATYRKGSRRISFLLRGAAVHVVHHRQEKSCALLVCTLREAAHQTAEGGVRGYLAAHERVEAEGHEEADGNHGVELEVYGAAESVGAEPDRHHEQVGQEYGRRRAYVGEAEVYEQVVEVGLVGAERGLSAADADRHDPQRVENRDAHHRERERNQAEGRVNVRRLRVGGQNLDHESHQDHAHHQRAAVAYEHLGPASEDIVQEKRNQRADRERCENQHVAVAQTVEHRSEESAGEDAETGRIAVDPVNQVRRVDDANSGKDRERRRKRERDVADAPETVEIVYAVARHGYQASHEGYFRRKTELGRQAYDVVESAEAEHDAHRPENHEKVVHRDECLSDEHPNQKSEEHRGAAEYRHGNALELAGIGIVDNVLVHRYPQDLGIDPPDGGD